ncbi:MAG: AmmeMemoRadiSam system protein B [Candidatus Omnitrophota bacterium]
MIKNILIVSFLIFILCGGVWAADKLPNAIGAFYPAGQDELRSMVDGFLKKAEPPEIKGTVIALISPHAGYIYSGQTAAYGYKALKDKKFDTVIIIAPSHYIYFDGFSVYPEGNFMTPLGEIEVDSELAGKIISKSEKIFFKNDAFKKEHSLEVQLPFLQRTFSDFKIVPVISGNASYENYLILADAVASSIDHKKKILIIASTDLSHFHSYEEAENLDSAAIDTIEKMEPEFLFNEIKNNRLEMCGGAAVISAMLIAKRLGADNTRLLKYANSGDVTSNKSSVVGYASMVILKTGKERKERHMLNETQRKKLIEIARQSISVYLKNGESGTFEVKDEILKEKKGAFVTLTINSQLRGCIGRLAADTPLYEVIAEMAVEAAFDDPRFRKLSEAEFKNIKIEISVLSPFKKIDNLDEIEVGRHGLLIRKGFYSGLLLPQVADDYGWNRQEFLENVCCKAGLDKDAYKQGAEIYIFSAEVFGEE